MVAHRISVEELELDIQAYYDAAGNKSEAARVRGMKRQTYQTRLKVAERELGIQLGQVASGRVGQVVARQLDLPPKDHVKRYVLSSLQNNTHLHPGFDNVLALVDWLDRRDGDTCELMIGTFSYNKASYREKAVKRGTLKGDESQPEWFATEAEPYFVDEMVQLAPALVWNGHMNILPTNKHPLQDFETYNGRLSNVVPHAQIAMESVASMPDESTKINYSTGTVGQLNYIQKRAGILAEQRHCYGGLLVEVDHNGWWWVRQLHIDVDGAIHDIGPAGTEGCIRVHEGEVHRGNFIKGINWGDAHASEMDLWIHELGWAPGGMLDQLHPQYQFMNDLFSMRSRGHHEMKDFLRMYEKYLDGEESVEGEVQVTADFMREAHREWCETVVIPSNHDRHLDRWLNETDHRADPLNAKFFCWLEFNRLDALDHGNKSFNPLEFALTGAGSPDARFLDLDEGFVICRDTPSGGIECGLHGHEGVNGGRGSTQALTKLGRAINKGHDHIGAIRLNVYGAGACALRLPYMHGPQSHSATNTVTFDNGTRQQVTMWAGKFRA